MSLRPIDGSAKRIVHGDELRRRLVDEGAADSAANAVIRLAPGLLGRPAPEDTEAVDALAAEQDHAEQRYLPNRADRRRAGVRRGR